MDSSFPLKQEDPGQPLVVTSFVLFPFLLCSFSVKKIVTLRTQSAPFLPRPTEKITLACYVCLCLDLRYLQYMRGPPNPFISLQTSHGQGK